VAVCSSHSAWHWSICIPDDGCRIHDVVERELAIRWRLRVSLSRVTSQTPKLAKKRAASRM
jgi:hypothetical protein